MKDEGAMKHTEPDWSDPGGVGEAVAIIGIAGRFPGARDVDELWRNLRDGVESIRFFTPEELERAGVPRELTSRPDYVPAKGVLEDPEHFDAAFFGLTPRQAASMDPQHRLFLECCWQAMDDAGYRSRGEGDRTGVFAGAAMSTYLLQHLAARPELLRSADALELRIANDKDFLTTLVSYHLDLHGPSVAVQTACSTSLVAVHLACQALLDGDCDLALAGGVAVSFPHAVGYLYHPGGIHSPDGHCRAFDARAGGAVEGNGAGVVVLKRLSEALADGDVVDAVIRGTAVNNDGARRASFTAPSVASQTAVVLESLSMAGVDPRTVTLVEAHGSATELGDPIEVEALTRAFRTATADRGFCALGSVKTNLGHLDNAAGIASLLKAVLALRHRKIPPSLHFERPNPRLNLVEGPFYVASSLAEWRTRGMPRRAGVSSLGIGGTNAHLVLEEAPEPRPSGPSRPDKLLVLSARTATALESLEARLAEHLADHPDLDLADIAYTLQVGRRPFGHRRALLCGDLAEARDLLARPGTGAVTGGGQPGVAFLLPGLGDHYPGMGGDLYRNEPIYRDAFDRCAELAADHAGLDLVGLLYGGAPAALAAPPAGPNLRRLLGRDGREDDERGELDRAAVAQPALFAVEYALARLWMEVGVRPQAMIGYSLGEYVAACLAGVWTLEEALLVVCERARLIDRLEAGAMLAVPLAADELTGLLGDALSPAVLGGPGLTVVAGSDGEVAGLERRLADRGIACRRLRAGHAIHTPAMAPVARRFAEVVGGTRRREPEIPFLSNLTGTWITPRQATDPEYWVEHLCRPVRFADGLGELLAEPGQVFLEVGPGETLSTLLRQHPAYRPGQLAVASLGDRHEAAADARAWLSALGRAWEAGAAVDWRAFAAGERRRRVRLPTYPFERRAFRFAPQLAAAGTPVASAPRPLDEWFWAPAWRQSPRAGHLPGGREGAAAPTRWLLLTDGLGLGARLAERLRDRGHLVLEGDPSLLDAGDGEGYDALAARLAAWRRPPYGVVHLGSVDAAGEEPGIEPSERHQERGFGGLLRLLQALGRHLPGEEVELTVVATGLARILGDEPLAPQKAALLGLAKVASQEYPHLACRSVDLIAPRAPEELERCADGLAAELARRPQEPVVAYRAAGRWVRDFAPVRLPPPDGTDVGPYLITAGTGETGLRLAEELARRSPGIRLALVAEAEPAAGGAPAAGMEGGGQERADRLRALRESGCEVLVLPAELAAPARLPAALEEAQRRLGGLRGVVYIAAAPAGGVLQLKDPDEAAAALAARIEPALALAAAARRLPLEVFALFSSTAAVAGGFGQLEAAASAAWLDALAHRLREDGVLPAVSIGWSPFRWEEWKLPAAAPPALAERLRAELAAFGIAAGPAGEAFARAAAAGLSQVVVSPRELAAVIAQNEVSAAGDLGDTLEAEAADAGHPRPSLAIPYRAPGSDTEEVIAAIWARAFGLDRVGVDDNFFDLDGNSLLALQIATRLRSALGVEVPMPVLFEAPTVGELARRADELRVTGGGATIPLRGAHNDCALSLDQERLWFIQQLDSTSPLYNIYSASRLRGRIDHAAFRRSLGEVVRRHEIMRTIFVAVDGVPVQRILPATAARVPVVDLSALPAAARRAQAARLAAAEAARPFELTTLPLFRVLLLREAADDHVCTSVFHHIVSDWVSFFLFQRELSRLYEAFTAGLASPLAALPIQYADYALWQRRWAQGPELERQLDYWRGRLAGVPPVLDLPTDHPRPKQQRGRGARQPVALPAALSDGVRALAQGQRVTLFMALQAAFKALLFRLTGQRQIVVGAPVAHRHLDEVEELLGFFLNQLVFATPVAGDLTFRQLLQREREVAMEAFAHQQVPFSKLVESLDLERDLSRVPLTQVVFLFLNPEQQGEIRFPGIEVEPYGVDGRSSKFDLTLALWDAPGGFSGWLEHDTDLFERPTVMRLGEQLIRLLTAAVDDPDGRLDALPLLGAAARQQLLTEWNDTAAAPPPQPTVDRWLAARAAATPDAVALDGDGGRCSFAYLEGRAAALARRLRRAGVGPEARVGLMVERSPALVAGVWAILAAGGAYLPLDPADPPPRLATLLAEAAPPVVLTRRHLAGRLPAAVPRLLVDGAARRPPGGERWSPAADPQQLAYVLYTSGSTGRPKGVEVPHRALVGYLAWAVRAYRLGPGRGAVLHSSLSFDLTVTSLLAPLLAGGTVELAPGGDDAGALARALGRPGRVQLVKLTPSHLELLRPDLEAGRCPAAVGVLVVGGEALLGETLAPWRRRRPELACVNEYGPTEAVVGCTAFELPAAPAAGAVPIGRPIAGARVHLLDGRLEPVPLGVTGELHVGGRGLARGYLARPAQTAERFLPDPFAGHGCRLYRTGDLARHRPGGELEFMGRADGQIKVRGYRIEPAEIEAALLAEEGVREAAVATQGEGPGDRRLVAYVAIDGAAAEGTAAAELLQRLAERLPGYMVPSIMVPLASLPRTASGKLDRRALPAAAASRLAAAPGPAPPRTPVEELLAGIWAEVLGLARVGADDDFFRLGGHSLLATQVLSRLREALEVDLPVSRLFEHPTVEGLARQVEAAMTDGRHLPPPVRRHPGRGPHPLSYGQEPLWLLDRALPGLPFFTVPAALHLAGDLDVTALQRSLRSIARRHAILRTTFAAVDGRLEQIVSPEPSLRLAVVDLSPWSAEEGEGLALALAQRLERLPFDLATGPLLRLVLLRLGRRDHRLLFTAHHIVSDAWSVGVLVRELMALYDGHRRGQQAPLPELPVQYADYARWQRQWLTEDVVAGHLAYWRRELGDRLEPLRLPTDFPRPEERTFTTSHQQLRLPPELTERLVRLSRQERVTLFTVLLTAFSVLLHRRTGRQEVRVGTLAANRTRKETEGLIGLFVNTLVLRADLSGRPTFRQLLRRLRATLLEAFAHQDLPFELLQRELRRSGVTSEGTLAEVLLVLQNAPLPALELPGLTASRWPPEDGYPEEPVVTLTDFDLVLMMEDGPAGLGGVLKYKSRLFRPQTAARMLQELGEILEHMISDLEATITRG